MFLDYFAARGLPSRPTAFDGRSDYGPFIAQGIPAGGLFSGAEALKTEAEAGEFGGMAGEPYDPCYHQACDGLDNVDLTALDVLSDAAAHAVWIHANAPPQPAIMAALSRGAGRMTEAIPLDALPLRGGGHYQK